MVGVELAAIDELLGDGFVEAEVDEYHELDGVLDGLLLRGGELTSSSMTKFLIMRWRVCLRMSVVRMTSLWRQWKHLQQKIFSQKE